jgi:hypothetical protein
MVSEGLGFTLVDALPSILPKDVELKAKKLSVTQNIE